MNRPLLYLVFVFSMIIIVSCEKNNDESEDDINSSVEIKDSIRAGIYDTSFYYYEFPTPLEMNPVWDTSMLVGYANDLIRLHFGSDSLCINFHLAAINPDSINVIGNNIFVPMLSVKVHDSVSIYEVTNTYYVGQGCTTDITFAQAFHKHDIIRSDGNWHSNNSNFPSRWLELWAMPIDPGTIANYHGGPWLQLSIGYLGFKYKNRLGWIMINNTFPRNPKFISYAIRK